jgi:hypothetical protein
MALTLTNPTLTNPADKTEIQENFTDVANKFNAGLTTADFSATAGITNGQLANSYYEFTVNLWVQDRDAAPAGEELIYYYPLPNLATDGPYTIVACDYYIADSGTASSTTVSVASGTVAAGVFSGTTTHVNAQSIAAGGANEDVVGTFTLANSTIPASANNRVLRLIVSALATNALTEDGSMLSVTLKLKRQLRS